MPAPIAILGAGSFGTALAIVFGGSHDVALWTRRPALAESIDRERRNPLYLSEFKLPTGVRVTSDLGEALASRELAICALPSQGLRALMKAAGPHLAAGSIVVCATKGLEEESGLTMNQVLEEVLPEDWHPRLVALSGPSFAREVASPIPTAVTPACREEAVAIAAGISDGLELGTNSRAALMTRGLAEVAGVGVRLGASPLTFLGLAGLGDLILTCTGDLSRNRHVGLELGRGRKLADVLAERRAVAEGVKTTPAACELAW